MFRIFFFFFFFKELVIFFSYLLRNLIPFLTRLVELFSIATRIISLGLFKEPGVQYCFTVYLIENLSLGIFPMI
jgi:hypothetical protein